MKLISFIIWLMAVPLLCVSAQKKPAVIQPSQRVDKIVNSNWTFNYFPSDAADKGYESPSFDDTKWFAVSIPHTWQTYETTGELNSLIRNASESENPYWRNGWGWYRKHFSINQAYAGRKVFIEFAGVQKFCKVWINGVYLGDHTGGNGSFDFEITQHIKMGGDNVIAVAVSNTRNDKLKIPITESNYNVYGGISRDVTIALRNNLYIPMQGSASHEGGTFITTPELDARSGLIRIQTWVKNDNKENRDCVLQTSVYDAANKLVQQIRSTADINPNQIFHFDQTTKPVKNPHLWSPEDPYLYKVVSEVSDGKIVVDSYTNHFGFRWFRWDYNEKVLYLNGKKTVLHGGISLLVYPWLGNAVPKWIIEKDYADMSERLGYNFMKVAGSRNDRMVYDLAYKYGIIIDEEVPDIGDFSPEAHNSALSPTFNGKTGPSQVLMAGEPAKIVLKASHNKITADRGSIAIIQADIVDSKGNHLYGVKKTLKWTVIGPAAMVGPSMYVADNVSHFSGANVIRSTGDAGNIKVTVSASGLASGSVSIISEDVLSDNSVIAETVLRNEGRTGHDRVVLRSARLEDIPREIKLSDDPIKLTATGKAGFRMAIRDQIVTNNPSVDTASVEFRALAELFASYLANNNGQLSAYDYNFNVDHFNTCRLISGYINATKLPPPFKDGLRIYYSGSVIKEGNEKDAGEEMNWLNWIPSGGTVVYFNPEAKGPPVMGTLRTSKNELSELISLVHPGFEKFSDDAKERALGFIARMNPYVHADVKSEVVDGKELTTTRLLAEKGHPVLIPLYKFIAE